MFVACHDRAPWVTMTAKYFLCGRFVNINQSPHSSRAWLIGCCTNTVTFLVSKDSKGKLFREIGETRGSRNRNILHVLRFFAIALIESITVIILFSLYIYTQPCTLEQRPSSLLTHLLAAVCFDKQIDYMYLGKLMY